MPADVKVSSCWTIVCDFDGTISPIDVTDRLLERFAAPNWLEIERAWQAGRINSRQCLIQQTELLSMDSRELKECLDEIHIDPDFVKFVAFAQSMQCDVRVASDGYTQVIRRLLNRAGAPPLPIAATYMIPSGANRWMLGCPFALPDCASGAATCKCAVARQSTESDRLVLVIGDGRSDFCVAAQADFVFARGPLLEHCRTQGLPHSAVADFMDAQQQLAALLETNALLFSGARVRATESRHG
jgi:2-hydroxy-3-keto-5-methylthiopentenyl-1-phosphate phosphatase